MKMEMGITSFSTDMSGLIELLTKVAFLIRKGEVLEVSWISEELARVDISQTLYLRTENCIVDE
jgi:hypothetical protein